jgi:hypothetical protein
MGDLISKVIQVPGHDFLKSGPVGNLDDALIAEAAAKAEAKPKPKISEGAREAMASVEALAYSQANAVPEFPFSVAPESKAPAKFSISLTPSVRGLKINSAHPLETTVEEIGGEFRLIFNW